VITASDGKASASLAAFSMTIGAPAATTGQATLSWSSPTANVDGTPINNLAGYRVYYGKSAAAMTSTIDVDSGATSFMVRDLAPATWFFAVKAYTNSGAESELSNVASKVVM
jgi:hypothetical protein